MSYTVLYRKYRPAKFDAVIGQESIVRILRNQVKSERLSHAYLFCGPKGTGKTSVARILAHAANCLSNVNGEPCGNCSVCLNSSTELLDIIEIDAASNNGVDQIRELKDKVKFPPSFGRFKVYIIDEVHMLTPGAFNALLKTLEEPPSHVIFIFATTEFHKLPATILSRCQRYNFKRIPEVLIVKTLEMVLKDNELLFEPAALEAIAGFSEGSMRDALSLLDQCIGVSEGKLSYNGILDAIGAIPGDEISELASFIYKGDVAAVIHKLSNLFDNGSDMLMVLRDLIFNFRNVLVVKVCDRSQSLSEMISIRYDDYRNQAAATDTDKLLIMIESLSRLESELRWSTQVKVSLEIALVKLCKTSLNYDLEDIGNKVINLEKRILSLENSTVQPLVKVQTSKSTLEGSPDSEVRSLAKHKTDDAAPNIAGNINKQNTGEIWAKILKTIKNEREAYYGLLHDAKPEMIGENSLQLNYPPGMEFVADMAVKEDNRKYLEEILFRQFGRKIKVIALTHDKISQKSIDESKKQLTKKVFDLFGEENVEIVEN